MEIAETKNVTEREISNNSDNNNDNNKNKNSDRNIKCFGV